MSLKIMVNGLPGAVAQEVTKLIIEKGLELVPYSLTGENIEEREVEIAGITVKLIKPSTRNVDFPAVKQEVGDFISIDYTHPTAVNSNAEFYIAQKAPFVMGTTGGDREKLMSDTKNAGLYAVIAPNMAKQVVAFQAMMEYMAENFPNAFSGYELMVEESHQKTKADTSGTAKAVVASMQKLGLDFSVDQIDKIREESEQMEIMGVPSEYLGGHAFHTYSIDSCDSSVHFEFQHNICGRKIYAEGTLDAVAFLAKQIEKGAEQKLYSMIDVLKNGNMG